MNTKETVWSTKLAQWKTNKTKIKIYLKAESEGANMMYSGIIDIFDETDIALKNQECLIARESVSTIKLATISNNRRY